MINYKYNFGLIYGKTIYFLADRCFNNDMLKAFNQYKCSQVEFVTFDCGLFDMSEKSVDEILEITGSGQQILAVIIRPNTTPNEKLAQDKFEFCGYDLVEEDTSISAILNCGALFEKIYRLQKVE